MGHPVQGINDWHGFRELQCYSQLLRSVRHVLVMDEQVTRCETSSATTEMALTKSDVTKMSSPSSSR